MPQPPFHNALGSPFIELKSVDSTNNYAHTLLKDTRLPNRQEEISDLQLHGTSVFALEQVAGKGQRGKIWASEKGANIALSIIIKPAFLHLSQQFHLSVCVAVALQEFFSKYAGTDTKIKWPNDLYWQDRKAGGVLIESLVRSNEAADGRLVVEWEWSIVGIGLNINQTAFPVYLANPVSLKQITGKSFDALSLAKEICETLNRKFSALQTGGFEKIFQDYLLQLYKKNELVKFRKDNRVFEAVVKSVSPAGRLMVFHSFEEEFEFGELEWVL